MFLFLKDKGAEKISVLPREIWDICIFQKYNLQKRSRDKKKGWAKELILGLGKSFDRHIEEFNGTIVNVYIEYINHSKPSTNIGRNLFRRLNNPFYHSNVVRLNHTLPASRIDVIVYGSSFLQLARYLSYQKAFLFQLHRIPSKIIVILYSKF